MKTTLRTGRLILDEITSRNIESMVAILREEGGSHVRLHPSKLGCWALNCFFEKYFEKEKKRMLDAHTDKKATLMSLIKNLDSGEESIYLDTLLKLSRQKGERPSESGSEKTVHEITE